MTDFNKVRKETYKYIDEFASSGNYTENDIVFLCMKKRGYSAITIKKYIGVCVERGFFVVDDLHLISMPEEFKNKDDQKNLSEGKDSEAKDDA